MAIDNEAQIEALLADPAHAGHPLREALDQLYGQLRKQMRSLERITRISDHYQSVAQHKAGTLGERLDKQLRQIERIARISDRYQAMLQDLNKRLEHESTHDALTGLANRRLGLKYLAERLEANGQPCIALVDADDFKRVNDRLGHEAGDRALVYLARVLRDPVGAADLVARWGGEEFLLVWAECDLESVRRRAEALRSILLAQAPETEAGVLRITASFGLARRREGESASQLLSRADDALYAAKAGGRDQIMSAD